MNERQRRFVAAYLRCRNAAEAARRSGVGKRAAANAGHKLLRKPAVIAALGEAGIATGANGELLHRGARGADGLNQRQRRFVAEYRLSRNAQDAALRAGYAERSAATLGSRQLRDPAVIAALEACGVSVAPGVHPRDQCRKPRAPFLKHGLTARQQRFVDAYLVLGNASAAALRAGLSERNPGSYGARLLRHPMVAAALARERAILAERLQIDAARVTAEYARLAFANIADFVEWGPGVTGLRWKEDVGAEARAAILIIEMKTDAKGTIITRLKLHSKLAALDALARHLGLDAKGATQAPPPEPDEPALAYLRERIRRLGGDKS